jgi:mRNA interferase MazF
MSAIRTAARGRIYAAFHEATQSEKYFVIVSNNRRNLALPTSLAVRLTTATKPSLTSIVELSHSDPLVGRALCDDITELYHDELLRDLGAVSPRTMESINEGLRAALGL